MIVKGRITQILPVEKGTSKAGKEWQKQSIVIDTGSQFNPMVCISFFGEEKIAMLKNYKEGQEVEISINLSSREFDGKWFHNVDGWRIVNSETGGTNAVKVEENVDDLPF